MTKIAKLYRSKRSQAGITLVDVIVAMALISLALISAGVLAVTSSRVGDEAGRRTEASTLAGLELEALHDYRDTHAQLQQAIPFFATTAGCASPPHYYMYNDGTAWKIHATGAPRAYSPTDENSDAFFNNADLTQFSRYISICDNGNPNIKTVEVDVYWREATGPIVLSGTQFNRRVVLRTVLTNWAIEP